MFENESDKVRKDIVVLQRMIDHDELEAHGYDLFKIEWALNTALDHIEFLKSNLPYEHMSDDIEDEVVECDALMDKANQMIEVCKVKYHLDNSFFRDHVTPEFKRKIVDKSHSKKSNGTRWPIPSVCRCLISIDSDRIPYFWRLT